MVFSKPVAADLSVINGSDSTSGPFEGPEKLLEVWFTPSKDGLANHGTRLELSGDDFGPQKLTGLRTVSHDTWNDMLDSVNCKVLSIIEGEEVDAYLLSESSMFVWPHKIILKTCGTTTLLFGLNKLLDIARERCGFPGVWRLFYSRKTYMFPERQKGPHKTWEQETEFLNKIFINSSTYTVGQTNRDHWFLYLTSPQHHIWTPSPSSVGDSLSLAPRLEQDSFPDLWRQRASELVERDVTLEILMTGLSPRASKQFYSSEPGSAEGSTAGNTLAVSLGIDASSLIGSGRTDAYLFSPCGFSANMVGGSDKQRYATIHVTPEQTHSFASFESNVDYSDPNENLRHVITQIVNVFEPRRLSITLFDSHGKEETEDAKFLDKHLPDGYTRVDWIEYKFSDYDLLFLSFERPDHPLP